MSKVNCTMNFIGIVNKIKTTKKYQTLVYERMLLQVYERNKVGQRENYLVSNDSELKMVNVIVFRECFLYAIGLAITLAVNIILLVVKNLRICSGA